MRKFFIPLLAVLFITACTKDNQIIKISNDQYKENHNMDSKEYKLQFSLTNDSDQTSFVENQLVLKIGETQSFVTQDKITVSFKLFQSENDKLLMIGIGKAGKSFDTFKDSKQNVIQLPSSTVRHFYQNVQLKDNEPAQTKFMLPTDYKSDQPYTLKMNINPVKTY